VNKAIVEELKNIAEKAESIASLKPGDFVLDIGSHNGTFLRSHKTKGLNLIRDRTSYCYLSPI